MKSPLAFLALLPSLLFAASNTWDGTADTTWYTSNKDTTEYTIRTAEELAGLARLVNGVSGASGNGIYDMSGKTIKLGDDIALNDTTNWKNWPTSNSQLRQWSAISTSDANSFRGTFDGDSYTISGVYIDRGGTNYQGLFIYNSGTIKNLGVIASYIKGYVWVGGLVAINNGTIINSYATSNLHGNSYVGGLVGYNYGTISNSYATGYVSGLNDRGGLVGKNFNGTISNSYATGNVTGEAGNNKGGLVGSFTGPRSTISNSYAIGNVLGGGNVVGGLVGNRDGGTIISNSYYNIATSEQNDTGKGEGRTTEQMQDESNYNGWDFNEIWGIGPNPNGGMPYLLWQGLIKLTEIDSIPDKEYTGSQIKPEPNVSLNGLTNDDFYYKYGENLNAGKGSVTVVGKTEDYYGEKTVTFNIVQNKTDTPDFLPIEPITAKFDSNLTLAKITGLPSNCNWADSTTQITKVDEQEFDTECSNPNYEKKATGQVLINVTKGVGYGEVSIASWRYGEEPKIPSTSSLSHDTPTIFYYTGQTYYSTEPPTDVGDYTVTATFEENENYNSLTKSATFTISKAQGTGSVSIKNWYAAETASQPVPVSSTNGTAGVTYLYWSTDGQTYMPSSSVPSNPGLYIVEATFPEQPNYSSFTASNEFEIFENINVDVVNVTWDSDCGANATFIYDGTVQFPVPSAEGYVLAVTGKQTNAGSHTAAAQLAEPNKGVSLQNDVCPYTILPKPLQVSWTAEREFVYNKMVQVPKPSVEEPDVELRVLNGHSAAGVYEGVLAPFAQIVSSNAGNYELGGHTIDKYEIKQKPLKPYFSAMLPAFEYNTDTLWVPSEVFTDTNALQKILGQVIAYDGFATDTVKNETDGISVLNGKPKVSIEYAASPMLQRRVETSQKATAIISTDEMSADNYNILTRPAIVIMETIEDEEEAEKIDCYRGSYCTELSKEICDFIDGEEVPSCSGMRKSCVIDDRCVDNMLIGECTGIGGETLETACDEVPTLRPQLSASTFRVWQTASGTVNVDLGYMHAAPAKLQIYDLKGNLVATEQVNTRFANVKVNVPSGVYLLKAGSRVLKAAIL